MQPERADKNADDDAKKNASYKIVECHIPNIPFDENGVIDYYWPLSTKTRTQFAQDLLTAYAAIVKNLNAQNPSAALPYKFFGIYFITEMVALFQGDYIREQLQKNNAQLNAPDDWRYWPSLLNEKAPPSSAFLEKLKAGPKVVSKAKKLFSLGTLKRFKKILNLKPTGLKIDGLSVKPITQGVLKDCVIALERLPLICEHAQKIKKEVVFCRSDRWFSAITEAELSNHQHDNATANDTTVELVIKTLDDLYQKYDIPLKKHTKTFAQNLLKNGATLCDIHYHRLINSPTTLPAEVWSGTTGNIWNTMLRVAVNHHGGRSAGHDHGSGIAYIHYPLMGTIEFWGCDEFITFNDNHAREMSDDLQSYPVYDDTPPKIVALNKSIEKEPQNFARKKDIKNIFVMTTLYDNDRGRAGPGNTNNFLLDWQIRQLTGLKNLGYNVTMKIHPENKVPLPDNFAENLGITISTIPFTQVMDQADLVVFDCIYTTAFKDCLTSNIPVLVFDIFDFPWTKTGKELIDKRIEIVKVDYRDNRAHPDWSVVPKAIESAHQKSDNHEFYTHYFL